MPYKSIKTPVKGYKVFKLNRGKLDCRGFKFGTKEKVVGSVHENLDRFGVYREPVLCDTGFHFCKQLKKCFKYYSMVPTTLKGFVVCEVEGHKHITANPGADKVAAGVLKITKILSVEEVAKMLKPTKSKAGVVSERTYSLIIKSDVNWRGRQRRRSYFVDIQGRRFNIPRQYAFKANIGMIIDMKVTITNHEQPNLYYDEYNTRYYTPRKTFTFL